MFRASSIILALLLTFHWTQPAWSSPASPWTLEILGKSADCGPLPKQVELNARGQLILPWTEFVNSKALVSCEISGLLQPSDAQSMAFELSFTLQGDIGGDQQLGALSGLGLTEPALQDNLSIWFKLEGEPALSPEIIKRAFYRFHSGKDFRAWVSTRQSLVEPICSHNREAIPIRIVLKVLSQNYAIQMLKLNSLTLELKELPTQVCEPLKK